MIPLISVIIPSHNSEDTITRCISSVSNSTYKNIEIIIINDRSIDNTDKIIQELSEKDQRIKIIRIDEEKGGASRARNIGMREACGEYLSFVDADDYVSNELYEKAALIITKYHPDLLDFNYYYVTDNKSVKQKPNKVIKDQIHAKEYLEDFIIPAIINSSMKKDFFIENYLWTKMYRRNIIRSNDIKLNENRSKWEDKPFIAQYLKYSNSFYSSSFYGYYYVNTSNSLSKTKDPYLLRTVADSYDEYVELFGDKYDFNDKYPTNYYGMRLVDVTICQIESFGSNNHVVNETIKEVFSRDSVQNIFHHFDSVSWIEKKMREEILSKNIIGIIILAKLGIAQKNIRKYTYKIQSLVTKYMNYLIIHLLYHKQ